jgi:hypothetical protein
MANPRPPEQQSQQHSETSSLQQRVAVGEGLQSPPSSGSSLSSLGSGKFQVVNLQQWISDSWNSLISSKVQ